MLVRHEEHLACPIAKPLLHVGKDLLEKLLIFLLQLGIFPNLGTRIAVQINAKAYQGLQRTSAARMEYRRLLFFLIRPRLYHAPLSILVQNPLVEQLADHIMFRDIAVYGMHLGVGIRRTLPFAEQIYVFLMRTLLRLFPFLLFLQHKLLIIPGNIRKLIVQRMRRRFRT